MHVKPRLQLKNKNHWALKSVEMVLRPALTTIEPMLDEILKKMQAQPSHRYTSSFFIITIILLFTF